MRVYLPMVLGALAVLAIAGCDPVTEDQCRAGDWRSIGERDGAAGRDAAFFQQIANTCANVGVTPDRQAWLAGRADGLQSYCTPRNAYSVARSGSSLNPVCPAAVASELRSAEDWGRRYHEIDAEESRARSDLSTLRNEMQAVPADNPALQQALFLQISATEQRISRLNADKRRYDSWPP